MGTNGKAAGLALCMSAAVCCLVLPALTAFAGGAEDFRVLGISPQDGRAVVETPGGEKKVIKAGDTLAVSQPPAPGGRTKSEQLSAGSRTVTVVEIAEGRVVFEETRGEEKATVIIRLTDGKQRSVRIRKTGEKRSGPLAPQPAQAAPAKDGKKKKGGVP